MNLTIVLDKVDYTRRDKISQSTAKGDSFTAGLLPEKKFLGVLGVT